MSRNSYALIFSAALLATLTACNKSETPQTSSSSSIITPTVSTPSLSVQARIGGDGESLLKKTNCMGCHKMQGKLVGPGFAEVAKKYGSEPDAAAKLETKISKGGAGVWGTMPMPSMGSIHPDDIKVMVAYILTLSK
jgi:cytochrome c